MPGEVELAAKLLGLVHQDTLQITSKYGTFIAPKTVEDFSAAALANPNAWILGGGTDIGLWVNKALQTNATMIYTGEVAALKQIAETPVGLSIGAAVPLEPAFRAMNRHTRNWRMCGRALRHGRFAQAAPSAAMWRTAHRLGIRCPR